MGSCFLCFCSILTDSHHFLVKLVRIGEIQQGKEEGEIVSARIKVGPVKNGGPDKNAMRFA